MKRFGIIGLFVLCLAGCAHIRPERTETQALLDELLARIDSADIYRARMDKDLAAKRDALACLSPDSREYYTACMDLGGDYSSYIVDSAFVYYEKARQSALRLGDIELVDKASFAKARAYIRAGYFLEGSLILDDIPRGRLSGENLVSYYRAKATLYHSLYTSLDAGKEFRPVFVGQYNAYRDSSLRLLPPDSETLLREQEKTAVRSGNYDEAFRINDIRRGRVSDRLTKDYALVMFDRYTAYRYYMKRPLDDHVEYLLESAIADVASVNSNIASLRYVESWLISHGDVASAKVISDYYYSVLVRYGSRTRLLDALEVSMNVNEEYASVLRRQKHMLQVGIALIVLLLAVLAVIIKQILDSRKRIVQLNDNLDRSAKAARSYVLGFFNLYSSYISRLLALRSKINVNVRKGNTDYVLSLTDPSKDITGTELRQMYDNFDRAFLDIFPGFVEDFNALLRPECRFEPKPGERLNMELRIFAVIKLGISDSTKISELLHCSVKTVYNKRSEVNTKLRIPKERFAEELARI